MEREVLTLSDVSKFYTGIQSVVVGLNSVSLSFSRGEFVAITGESGSGKTTLSHVIGGILPYESGEMLFQGSPTSHYDGLDWEKYRRDNISFISQNYGILPGATVLKNVVSALRITGMDPSAAGEAAEKILRQVDLWDLRRRRAAKLSSGQKQRLSIARALAKPAPILIADEPTGNLDSENSAKVISLLAQAAQERLVILVTHEFSEAEAVATRHIVLQDGKVISDTRLREAGEPVPAPEVSRRENRVLSPYVARLQCTSRPVWATLMTCFFALTAFAVFAFLGVFIVSLDDTNTRIYDGSAFPNGSPTRLVVQRGDVANMTEEDYDAILAVSRVEALEPWGYVADAQYAYRENVDYQVYYELQTAGAIDNIITWNEEKYRVMTSAPFLQTVPVLSSDVTFLTGGRLPESFYEVVSADPDYTVGDTLRVFLWDSAGIGVNNRFQLEMTVVGTTDYGSGLYFSVDMARFIRQAMEMDGAKTDRGFLYFPTVEGENDPDTAEEEVTITITGTSVIYSDVKGRMDVVEDGYFIGSYTAFNRLLAKVQDDLAFTYGESSAEYAEALENFPPLTFYSDDVNADGEPWVLKLRPYVKVHFVTEGTGITGIGLNSMKTREYYKPEFTYHGNNMSQIVAVSHAAFDTLTWHNSNQVSITIEDYAYTDQVINALYKLGYSAISPFRLGSTKQDADLAAERTQTLRVCIAALAAVVALQIVLLAAMFMMETESYRLLSNIGLTGRTAKLSVLWQILALTVLGQLIGGTGIFLCGRVGVERIQELLRYLPAPYVLLLSGVHLAAAGLAALWVIRALGRQVYPLSGKDADIELDDDGEEAAV